LERRSNESSASPVHGSSATARESFISDEKTAAILKSNKWRQHGGGNGFPTRAAIVAGGYLKPKDLCMIPNRLAIALQDAGWWVRSEIVWGKPNSMPDSSGVYRPSGAHEKIFLLTKSGGDVYRARDTGELNFFPDLTERCPLVTDPTRDAPRWINIESYYDAAASACRRRKHRCSAMVARTSTTGRQRPKPTPAARRPDEGGRRRRRDKQRGRRTPARHRASMIAGMNMSREEQRGNGPSAAQLRAGPVADHSAGGVGDRDRLLLRRAFRDLPAERSLRRASWPAARRAASCSIRSAGQGRRPRRRRARAQRDPDRTQPRICRDGVSPHQGAQSPRASRRRPKTATPGLLALLDPPVIKRGGCMISHFDFRREIRRWHWSPARITQAV
jgi:hypothetical protein